MYYSESYTLDRRSCSGYRSSPDSMMFSSHDIGQLKAFFSQTEWYNDSNVSVSIRANNYGVDIEINCCLDKTDSWIRSKLYDAMNFVKGVVASNCSSSSESLPITINVYT